MGMAGLQQTGMAASPGSAMGTVIAGNNAMGGGAVIAGTNNFATAGGMGGLGGIGAGFSATNPYANSHEGASL